MNILGYCIHIPKCIELLKIMIIMTVIYVGCVCLHKENKNMIANDDDRKTLKSGVLFFFHFLKIVYFRYFLLVRWIPFHSVVSSGSIIFLVVFPNERLTLRQKVNMNNNNNNCQPQHVTSSPAVVSTVSPSSIISNEIWNTNVRNESDYVLRSLLTSCKFIVNSQNKIAFTLYVSYFSFHYRFIQFTALYSLILAFATHLTSSHYPFSCFFCSLYPSNVTSFTWFMQKARLILTTVLCKWYIYFFFFKYM